ncbi:MAG: UDP-N-acetylmuramoyl-L-alanyl-D-glutamate--2,6-diaminopimelate ligase [Rikenellaceae bacterium]
MKSLNSIIKDISPTKIVGECRAPLESVCLDSRKACAASLFVALRGEVSDGHNYISNATNQGASVVVCEELPAELNSAVCYIVVEDSHKALGRIASSFYDHPSRQLKLVGVTGTNGKTTTATLLCDLFVALGYSVGLISTVENRVGERRYVSTHTTPDAVSLQSLLSEMVDAGCEYCFMEVSSHSIAQSRIEGLSFDGAIFTNLTHDHLDYHKSFKEYLTVKKRLFDNLPKGAFALTNVDDRNGDVMVQNCKAQVSRYALRSIADFKCKIVEMHMDGMLLRVDGREVWVNFIGCFNAYNILSAYSTARLLGVDADEILVALSALSAAAGRFEYFKTPNDVTVVIDYAHTPDALENVISTINEIRQADQRLIVVFGCGGGRDAAKRPLMGEIATRNSSLVVITSDNPRGEEPEAIIADIVKGIPSNAEARHIVITSRKEAIRAAMVMAQPHDIVLLAGKGHETYQIIGDEKLHFDDREEARAALEM